MNLSVMHTKHAGQCGYSRSKHVVAASMTHWIGTVLRRGILLKHVRIYLAGPDIFLRDATEYAAWQKQICLKHDFVPLHPLDNNVGLEKATRKVSRRIFHLDLAQIDAADLIVANCNYFRGGCIDDGTAVELGYAFAKSKAAYGYLAWLRLVAKSLGITNATKSMVN